ncbi:MAG TPA: N-acetyl-gamma-glutamyl-phosphate reductase [Candidatus Scatosoma pullicola]|nr:N-acetyl-gamma-glutamyl-phosphate reductase [Candidatus Scatosoma pullicola]
MYNVFIDGREGTTGLQIYDRLMSRKDVKLLVLPEESRKDTEARKAMIDKADVVFLCLPDAAAKEAVALAENPETRIIDASTAHRTAPGWAYGFPELSPDFRRAIAEGKRIANPGCHASGFIALVYPLVAAGIVGADYPFVAHSVTGYSGGGKKMIAEYRASEREAELDSPRQYALTLSHKHLPEMTGVCGLSREPVFQPIVADYYAGMCVFVPLFSDLMKTKLAPDGLRDFYRDFYRDAKLISVDGGTHAYLGSNNLAGSDRMEIFVGGKEGQLLACARFDNLGKGASGAAVQNMNVALGLEETAFLRGV